MALFPIKAGEKVIKYGFPIGYAKEDIPVGAHVHVHNLHTGLSGELTYEYHPTYPTIPEIPAATFMGYPRKDGRVGVRNELWILPTVGCVNDIARQLERAAQGACRRRRGVSLCLPAPLWLLADGQMIRRIRARFWRTWRRTPTSAACWCWGWAAKIQRRHHRGAHGRLRQVARAFPRLPAGGR